MRSTIETLFYLRAARLKPEFKQEFGRSHVKTLNKVVGGHITALERIEELDDSEPKTSKDLKSVLEYMEAQGTEPADLQIMRVAKMAGLEETYRTDYARYSTLSHPTVLALEQIWDKPSPMAEPTGITWGPDKGELYALPDTLLQIAMSGLRIVLEMNEVFHHPMFTERIEQHEALQLKLLHEGDGAPFERVKKPTIK